MGKIIGLGIDLTHRCNLNCSFCWKFVKQSNYEMTLEQVDNFCKYFGHLKPKKLRITGGEPLMHPNFWEILKLLKDVFCDSIMQVTTNGLLLRDWMKIKRVSYIITPYPENEYLNVKKFPRPNEYFDRDHDPDLSDERAKRIHKNCLYKQIRVIGDNVYDCCHAETMERLRDCPMVHVKVGKDWEKEFAEQDKNRWIECVHCFVGDGGKKIGQK